MNELVLANRAADWRRLKMLVLDSVSSPITKRVYNLGLDEFFEWFGREPRPGFTKATVSAWRVALEARGLGSISINVRITAVRKLAVEAADNGLLAPELAAGITRIKGVKSKGVRVGNWLSIRQAQTLLNTPDVSTKKGLRDRAMLAVLLGCGLRRSEVAALTFKHIQQRDGRWCIVDLVGKHGRVRTIPMPTWVKVAIDAWTLAAGVAEGHVLRPVNRADQVQGERMSEKVVSYTWSKALDYDSGNNNTQDNVILNPFNFNFTRGVSSSDHTHRFVGSYVWELPDPGKPTGSKFMSAVLGNWQMSGIITLQSGRPFGISSSGDRSAGAAGKSEYADLTGNLTLTGGNRGQQIAQYFDTTGCVPVTPACAVQQARPGPYGTLGRNILRGPNFKNADLSISRAFPLKFREGAKLSFRSEFFNAFNRVNLGLPNSTIGNNTFGRITSTDGGPRILQFSLKMEF